MQFCELGGGKEGGGGGGGRVVRSGGVEGGVMGGGIKDGGEDAMVSWSAILGLVRYRVYIKTGHPEDRCVQAKDFPTERSLPTDRNPHSNLLSANVSSQIST